VNPVALTPSAQSALLRTRSAQARTPPAPERLAGRGRSTSWLVLVVVSRSSSDARARTAASTLLAGEEESWEANRGVLCAVLEPRPMSRSRVLRRSESRAGCCCLPTGSGEHDGVGAAWR